jgi:hypothetical protein
VLSRAEHWLGKGAEQCWCAVETHLQSICK